MSRLIRTLFATAMALIMSGALSLVAQTCSGSGGGPTLSSITLNGTETDWTAVLANPLQVTGDGEWISPCTSSTDRDCQGRSITGRDLARFAWTYDGTNIYLYLKRFGSSSNTNTFYFYADTNSNQLMNTGEKVLQVTFSGSNGKLTGTVYDYLAAGGAGGDAMVNGSNLADGYTMPGTLTSGTVLYSDQLWVFAAGDGFETRLPWAAPGLGVPAGTAVYFHVSSTNSSNAAQVPASIDDNLGGPDGGVGAFAFRVASLTADQASTMAPGNPAVMEYTHTLTNTGTLPDQYDFIATSTGGLRIDLFEVSSGNLMGTDLNGDGVWETVESGFDGNADNRPDSPAMNAAATYQVRVRITAAGGITDIQDITVLEARSRNASCVRPRVTDTTAIGALTLVVTPQSKATVAGAAVPYALRLNNYSLGDVFDMRIIGTAAFRYDITSDPNCDGNPADGALMATDLNGNGVYTDAGDALPADTNANARPDGGNQPNATARCFVVAVTPPPATPLLTLDVASVSVQGAAAGEQALATLNTTVRDRLSVTPSYTTAAGTNKFAGPGSSVFFAHALVNGWNAADSVTLSAVSAQGWTVRFWTDPNGDGNPGDGALISGPVALPAFGGTQHIVVEILIPSGTAGGTVDTATVTVASSLAPAFSATASDQVRVSRVASFSDSLRAISQTYYTRCQTVFVKGIALTANTATAYTVRYLNPSAVQVRNVTVPTDGNGEAFDQYTFGAGDPAGIWTLELRNNGTLVDSITLHLEPVSGAPTISALAFNQSTYALSGDSFSVSATFNNPSPAASYTASSRDYVVLNPGGTQYLTGAGTFAAYGGTELTRTTTPHDLAAASSQTGGITVNGVTFPGPGVYSVIINWRTSCGGLIATATRTFAVGSAFNSFSDAGHTTASDRFADGSSVYLQSNYLLPSTTYQVVYYDPAGNLVPALNQSVSSDGSGVLTTSQTGAALGTLGGWHAVIYPVGATIPATYNSGDAQIAAQDNFALVNPTPVVSGPVNAGATSISGTSTAAPGTTITVYSNGVPIGTTTVLGDGTWTLTGVSGIAGGESITATAGTGLVASDPSTAVIATPAAPVISGPIVTGTGVSVSGTSTAPNGSTVTVYVNGTPVTCTPAATVSGGTWSCGGLTLNPGDVVTSTVTTNGQTSSGSGSQTVQYTAPVVTGPITAPVGSISGTSSAADGTFLTVYRNGSILGTTTVTGGTWTLTGPFASLAGGESVTASAGLGAATSAVSNTVIVTPQAPVLNGPVIAGQATVGGTSTTYFNNPVDVFVNGSPVSCSPPAVVTGPAGAWSCGGLTLNPGDVVTASVTRNGVTSALSAPQTVLYASPTVSGPIYITDSTVSGTSGAADGTVITVYSNGVAIGTTTVTGGTWTLTGVSGLTGGDSITATTGSGAATSLVSGAVAVNSVPGLLRNAALGTLTPTPAQMQGVFVRRPGDPGLAIADRIVPAYASAAAWPQEATDYADSATPIVFYQLEGNTGNTLRVAKDALNGKLVISY